MNIIVHCKNKNYFAPNPNLFSYFNFNLFGHTKSKF